MMNKRVLGMRLAAVGAILLLLSVATKLWWSGMGLKVGPLGAEACGAFGCADIDMGQIGGGGWQVLGYLTFIGGVGGSLLGLCAVWSAWTRKRIGPARFDLNRMVLALGVASMAGSLAFAATRPGEAAVLSLGVGPFFAVIGAALLAAAALLLMQVRHAGNEGTTPKAPHITPCTRCGAPMRWIPEYGRFWCDREQAYV